MVYIKIFQRLRVELSVNKTGLASRDSLETTGNRVLDIMCLTWEEWR